MFINFQDLTRIEAGQVLFKTEPFDILSTVIDAAKMFKMDAKKNGILFEINAKKDIPMVVGDSHKIRQVHFLHH
jgi:signal transduction histidine kinase